MTDRIKGLTVAIQPDMREDDAEQIINAIKMIRGVTGVATHVADMDHYFATQAVRLEMGERIADIIYERNNKKTT